MGAIQSAKQRAEAQLACLGFGGTGEDSEIAIFRICLAKYREMDSHFPRASSTGIRGGSACGILGYPCQEFRADFELIARRTLDREQWLLLRYLLRTGLQPVDLLMESVAAVGRAFRETRPYVLYPCSEYFRNS